MRMLHPVAAHEQFLASGWYSFTRDGEPLPKRETWSRHEVNGGFFTRVDMDARDADGVSLLLEAAHSSAGELLRFDMRYENAGFDGGVKSLQAAYQFDESRLYVGYALNGGDRQYREQDLPADVVIDLPLLSLRGESIMDLARRDGEAVPLFVPMFEHVQLFPGVLSQVTSAVAAMNDDEVSLGRRMIKARRYRYRDKAAAYWIDKHGVIIKRVNAFKQREFVVLLRDYARRALPNLP